MTTFLPGISSFVEHLDKDVLVSSLFFCLSHLGPCLPPFTLCYVSPCLYLGRWCSMTGVTTSESSVPSTSTAICFCKNATSDELCTVSTLSPYRPSMHPHLFVSTNHRCLLRLFARQPCCKGRERCYFRRTSHSV